MIYLKNTTDNQIFYIMHKSSKGSGVWDLTSLDVEYTENGEYSITPPSGYDGLSRVNVTVDVPTGDYQEGYQDGIEYQKSRVQPLTVTQNHITYVNENGHSPIYVDIDYSDELEAAYQDGVSDGVDQQKEKLTSATFTENGTYQREDGWNEVTVDVSGGGSCNLETKSVTLDFVGTTEILPSSGYDGFSSVTVTCPTHIGGTAENPVTIPSLEDVIEGRTWGQYDWLYFTTYITRWVEENNVITAIDDSGITYNMGNQTIFSIYKNAGNNIADLKKGPRTFRIKPASASYSIENDGYCYTGYVNNVYWDEPSTYWANDPNKMKSISTIGNQYTTEENLFFDLSYTEDPDEPTWTVNGANNLGVYDERGNKVSGFTGTYDDNYTITYTTDTQIPAGKYTIRYSNANNYLAYYCNEGPEYPEKYLEEFYFDGEVLVPYWKTIRESYLCEDLSINPDNRIWFFTDDVDSITITWDGQQPTKSIKYVDCKVSLCPLGWTAEDVQSVQDNIDDTADRSLFIQQIIFAPMGDMGTGTSGSGLEGSMSLVGIPKWDTSNVISMANWFEGCTALQIVPDLDTSNVTTMAKMFDMNPLDNYPTSTAGPWAPALRYIPNFDMHNVTNASRMFKDCAMLDGCYKNGRQASLDLSSCTNVSYMFKGCYRMWVIPNLLNTGNVTDWSHTFDLCGYVAHQSQYTLTLDTSSATNMSYMFKDCQSLHNLSELDCSNVTNVTQMFDGVSYLEDFGGCKYLGNAFTGTNSAAHTLDLSTAFTYFTEYPTATLEASIHNVLSKLGVTSVNDAVVKLSAFCYNLADPADIADANAKGWSVVSA